MFEVLLFLAYVSVAFISVIIAVFTISVSYFRRESISTLWLLERREKELGLRIKKYKKMNLEQLQKDIDSINKEKSSINKKLFSLSPLGAVFIPCFAMIVSLFSSVSGLIIYPNNPEFHFTLSLFAIVIGSVFILKTLRTIGWAALRVPLPKLQIIFDDYQKEVKMNVNEKRKLRVGLDNYGDLLAEKVRVLMFFPPEFKISRGIGYGVVTQSKKYEEFPNYITVNIVANEVHIGICLVIDIEVEAPSKPDKYPITIRIYEKNVPETNLELAINVTE